MSGAEALFLALMLAASPTPAQASSETTCEKSIAFLEARGEGVKGIAGVRQVLHNRARHSREPICRVVKRRGQFSSYKRGMNLSKVEVDERFLTAWKKARTVHPLSSKYEYFYSGRRPVWARDMTCDIVIRHHVFCRA